MSRKSIIVIGCGNPLRRDDGIGPCVVEAFKSQPIPDTVFESQQMLNIEDADQIQKYDVVIFVDADVSGAEPFYFKRIKPSESVSFSSHHFKPEALLAVCRKMYKANTIGFVLGIRGYLFDGVGDVISEKALNNMTKAIHFLEKILHLQKFSDITTN